MRLQVSRCLYLFGVLQTGASPPVPDDPRWVVIDWRCRPGRRPRQLLLPFVRLVTMPSRSWPAPGGAA
jgi:hypothetical protein